jgi:hypothetical protein
MGSRWDSPFGLIFYVDKCLDEKCLDDFGPW